MIICLLFILSLFSTFFKLFFEFIVRTVTLLDIRYDFQAYQKEVVETENEEVLTEKEVEREMEVETDPDFRFLL